MREHEIEGKQKLLEKKQIYGIIGSIFLFVSLLLPFTQISTGYYTFERSFFEQSGDAYIILLIAIVSIVLSISKYYKPLIITGLISAAVLINILVQFSHSRLSLFGYNSTEVSDFGINHFLWGWNFLLFGTVLLLLSAFGRRKKI